MFRSQGQASLQNRRNFLRILGVQRRKQGEREAARGRRAKKLTPLGCASRFAFASLSPLFAQHARKFTTVLQAKNKQHSDDGGPLEIIANLNIYKKLSRLVEGQAIEKPTCAKLLKITSWMRVFTWYDYNTILAKSRRIKATTGSCCWTVWFVQCRNNCQSPL